MAAEKIHITEPASGSESVFDFFCELCADGNKHIEADGFCQDCGEFLCTKCFKAHSRNRFTIHHILLDKDQMPKDKTQSLDRNICKELCTDHSGKIVDFYCKTHDFFGCYVCITTKHKSCNGVVHIPEVSKTVKESEEFKKFENGFKTIQERSQAILELESVNTRKIEENYTQILEAIENQRRLINDTLDKLEADLQGKYEDTKLQDERRLKLASDACTDVLQQANMMLEDIETFTKNRQQCQIFTLMKKSKQQMESLQNTLKKAEKDVAIKEYTFKPNEDVQAIMADAEIIGSLSESTFRVPLQLTSQMSLHFKTQETYYGRQLHFWELVSKHNKTNKVVASLQLDDSFVPLAVSKVSNSELAITVRLTDKNIDWSYINSLL